MGALEFKYSVFGFGGSAVIDFEIGEFCQYQFENPGDILGVDYIGDIMPIDSMSNIEPDIIPFVFFQSIT